MINPWVSLHIFYSSNGNPLLGHCVLPLVRRLRARGLISRYFFIRYWLGGPHVRLRLLPRDEASAEAVKELAETEIRGFLAWRPALFQVDPASVASLYRRMYVAEYGLEALEARYGKDGEIPLYPNNSVHYIDYEEELERYGGRAGMTLSQKHFEVSSDVVLQLVYHTNIHLRTIMLGSAVRLMLQLCYGLLDTDEERLSFLSRYMDFWQHTYNEDSRNAFPIYDKKYVKMAPGLRKRIDEVRRLQTAGEGGWLADTDQLWVTHLRGLRGEIRELAEAGQLTTYGGATASDSEARQTLLTSYMHMTNNRLGVSILDEIYLSYILLRALEQHPAGRPAEEAVA